MRTHEDGSVSDELVHVRPSLGLRVVVGDQTGYAFTEDLSLEAMLAAARSMLAQNGIDDAQVAFDDFKI